MLWATQNANKVEKMVILNTPLGAKSKLRPELAAYKNRMAFLRPDPKVNSCACGDVCKHQVVLWADCAARCSAAWSTCFLGTCRPDARCCVMPACRLYSPNIFVCSPAAVRQYQVSRHAHAQLCITQYIICRKNDLMEPHTMLAVAHTRCSGTLLKGMT